MAGVTYPVSRLLYATARRSLLQEGIYMSEVKPPPAPEQRNTPTPPPKAEAMDLSAEIILAVERRAGDQVKCTRITSDTYRCNWWSAFTTDGYDNPAMSGLLVTTHRVRQSRFLHVTKNLGKLVITEKTNVTEGRG